LQNLENDVVHFQGVGVVVDADAGFILTDRCTVPQPLGDIEVSLGEVSRGASVWFMHPNHSLVLLKLDAPSAGDAAQFGQSAEFVDEPLGEGDELAFVGMDDKASRIISQVKVQGVRMGEFQRHFPPRWHGRNLEVAVLEEEPENASGGVICGDRGQIYALYAMVPVHEDGELAHKGHTLPSHVVLPMLEAIKAVRSVGEGPGSPVVPSLEIELRGADLAKLRRLPAKIRPTVEWFRKIKKASQEDGWAGSSGSILQVHGITSGGPCDGIVNEGDLLVAVAGRPVSTACAVDAQLKEAVAKSGSNTREPSSGIEVGLTLLRRGKVLEVTTRVALLGSDGARRLLIWNGLVLQEIPRSVREYGQVQKGVHVSEMLLGSPGEANAIEGEFVLSVDGSPTHSLDAFLALETGKEHVSAKPGQPAARRHLRVATADVTGRSFMTALEPDPLFWPTIEISMDPQGVWSCVEHVP
jgi:hypothetical protein